MKKIFTMALISLSFVACSKEETESKQIPVEKNEALSIEGTWGLESGILLMENKNSLIIAGKKVRMSLQMEN